MSAKSLNLDIMTAAMAPGYDADLIAIDGEPPADISALTRVAFAMKGGKVNKNIALGPGQ